MVKIKNPDAPATKRQLYRICQLTGGDTRGWDINMRKASNIIEALELEDNANNRKLVIPEGVAPFEEAKVTLIDGDQRSGKTCTGVAKIVDRYYQDCVRIYCKDVPKLDCDVKSYDWRSRVAKISVGGVVKAFVIPESYKLRSYMRIFSNLHLFGIPYVFVPSFRHCLKWLKMGFMSYGWFLMDEAQVGINARSSMTEVVKEMEVQSFQYGKAMLNVIMIAHIPRLVDWTARTIPTEKLSCTYDKRTKMVTYTRRKKGEPGIKEVTYYAPQYWPFFWTNERINA